MIKGLAPGRIVHYVDPAGNHYPSIVVKIHIPDTLQPKIDLVVFDCRDSQGSRTKLGIIYHPDNQLDTWHWPEPC